MYKYYLWQHVSEITLVSSPINAWTISVCPFRAEHNSKKAFLESSWMYYNNKYSGSVHTCAYVLPESRKFLLVQNIVELPLYPFSWFLFSCLAPLCIEITPMYVHTREETIVRGYHIYRDIWTAVVHKFWRRLFRNGTPHCITYVAGVSFQRFSPIGVILLTLSLIDCLAS